MLHPAFGVMSREELVFFLGMRKRGDSWAASPQFPSQAQRKRSGLTLLLQTNGAFSGQVDSLLVPRHALRKWSRIGIQIPS